MGFKNFEEIRAWQDARMLARIIRKFCLVADKKHDWSWTKQVAEAGLSVMANIAEGSDSNTNPEFISFLGYAKRSAAEVRSHLYYGFDEGYLSKEEFEDACARAKSIGAQLASLIRYLQSHTRNDRISPSSNQPTRNQQP